MDDIKQYLARNPLVDNEKLVDFSRKMAEVKAAGESSDRAFSVSPPLGDQGPQLSQSRARLELGYKTSMQQVGTIPRCWSEPPELAN